MMKLLRSQARCIAYAQIDLKRTTFRIVDGLTDSGVVDASAVIGATALDVSGFTTVLDKNARFKVAGSNLEYIIDGTTQPSEIQTVDEGGATGGTYTLTIKLPDGSTGTTAAINPATSTPASIKAAIEAVAFSSPLLISIGVSVTGPVSDVFTITFDGANVATLNVNQMIFVDSTTGGTGIVILTTQEGGGATTDFTFSPGLDIVLSGSEVITVIGNVVEIKIGEGNLTYTENREFNYTLNRGILDLVREGDEQPMDVSFDFVWEFLRSGASDTVPSIEEALKRRGVASRWVSTSSDPCETYTINIEVDQEPDCTVGAVEDERIIIPQFRHESLEHDAREGTVAVSGRSNAKEATKQRIFLS